MGIQGSRKNRSDGVLFAAVQRQYEQYHREPISQEASFLGEQLTRMVL